MSREGETDADRGLTLSQSRLSTGWLAQHTGACTAKNNGLCVREDGSDGKAACR